MKNMRELLHNLKLLGSSFNVQQYYPRFVGCLPSFLLSHLGTVYGFEAKRACELPRRKCVELPDTRTLSDGGGKYTLPYFQWNCQQTAAARTSLATNCSLARTGAGLGGAIIVHDHFNLYSISADHPRKEITATAKKAA